MKKLSKRELFFATLEGKNPEEILFVPDITDWYLDKRTPKNEPKRYTVGAYIPDEAPINAVRGTMPEKFENFTFLDFYKEFNWGLHSHVYDFIDVEYVNDVEYSMTETLGKQKSERIIRLKTSNGELTRRLELAADGTWCPVEHFVKNINDLEILTHIVESQVYIPRNDRVEKALKDVGDLGQVDISIRRSPFGKLVHEYMGFEDLVYALYDHPDIIHRFLKIQEERDLEVIKLAAAAPGRLIFMSDHADENLIAPNLFEEYLIPYYRKVIKIFHESGKFVSTHLDGNFKGYFDLLPKTTLDVLDGCTPAPMSNYEVEELADAMSEGMKCFCGVPSTLFCQNNPDKMIFDFADRIIASLKGRLFLNVGDVLPPDGNIDQVIALGEYIREKNFK